MNYLNGKLRNEQDATLRLWSDEQKYRLSLWEFAPIAVLMLLLLGMLMF